MQKKRNYRVHFQHWSSLQLTEIMCNANHLQSSVAKFMASKTFYLTFHIIYWLTVACLYEWGILQSLKIKGPCQDREQLSTSSKNNKVGNQTLQPTCQKKFIQQTDHKTYLSSFSRDCHEKIALPLAGPVSACGNQWFTSSTWH